MVHKQLRLRAEDGADLEVISAATQDSLLRIADAVWTPLKRRFSLKVQRFVWEGDKGFGKGQRVWSVLSFESVISVRSKRLNQQRQDAFAVVLSLQFEVGALPGGTITLVLADGGMIALDVECIDVVLADLDAPREAVGRPQH